MADKRGFNLSSARAQPVSWRSARAATDSRITKVAAINTLASLVTDEPYTNQRLGTLAPGILRDVGDVAHLAALCDQSVS